MSKSFKSMAADAAVPGVKKTDLWRVDPRLIIEQPGFNLRDYTDPEVQEHIRGFAKSYKEGKYVPPLMLRVDDDDNIVVVEGHCRRRGAMLAIEEGVDIQFLDAVQFKGNDIERIEVMLRSAEGLKLKPLMVAQGYLRLSRLGFSNNDIADRMNKTRQHVDQMMHLATANADVQQLVSDGKVSATTAIEAVREHGEKAGDFLNGKLQEAQKQGKDVVRKGAIQTWAPPRKLATAIYGSMDSLVSSFNKSTRRQLAELEKLPAAELKGKTVQVDAAVLLDLFSTHAKVVEAKNAKESSAREREAKQAQQGLDIDQSV